MTVGEVVRRRFVAGYALFFLLTSILLRLTPIPSPLFQTDYSSVVTDRSGSILRVFLNREEQWLFPPAEVDPPEKLRIAVLYFEDRHFFAHSGVHLPSIVRALSQNVTAGRRVSGGSTITMQLARIADPKPRTLRAKVLEMFQAWRIEATHDKSAILRLYVDHAPYGGNIRGVRAASLFYFGKGTESLSWAEAATLAVLPNAPSLVSPVADGGALKAKRNRLLKALAAAGYMNSETLEGALAEDVPRGRIQPPFEAPHFTRFVTARNAGHVSPNMTTLDLDIQHTVERLTRFHGKLLQRQGVANLAVLVVDTPSGEVRAYLGSSDFFDREDAGQVDGLQSPRSTGSILKPFLYALAIDDGMLLPESLVEDVPVTFGGFAPRNIDLRHRGLVPMGDALTASLNVPAAVTLSQVGLERFYSLLRQCGLTTLFRRPEDYGLPLVFGGAEATPWDIARLYRGLATGDFSDLTYRVPAKGGRDVSADGSVAPSAPLSDGSRSLILETLRDVGRPGADALWGRFSDGFPVAWKTGTSYGQRDAWAIGVTPEWTTVVWAGDFEGSPNPDLRSTTAAAPLLFDVMNTLAISRKPTWFEADHDSLKLIEVCAATGFRATPDCPDTAFVRAPRGARPLRTCPYHRTVFVDTVTGHRVDSRCWVPGRYEARHQPAVPPEAMPYMPGAAALPTWAPECGGQTSGDVAIAYPSNQARLFLPRDIHGRRQAITVRASHRSRAARLFWYLDEALIGETERSHQLVLPLTAGEHRLTVLDGDGNRDSVRFFVESSDG